MTPCETAQPHYNQSCFSWSMSCWPEMHARTCTTECAGHACVPCHFRLVHFMHRSSQPLTGCCSANIFMNCSRSMASSSLSRRPASTWEERSTLSGQGFGRVLRPEKSALGAVSAACWRSGLEHLLQWQHRRATVAEVLQGSAKVHAGTQL